MFPYFKIPHFYIRGGYASHCGPYATSILVNLMHHLNNKTGDCFPSEITIAKEMEISRNSVRKHIEPLIEMKIIEKKKKKMNTGNYGFYYIINTPDKWKKIDTNLCSPHEHGDESDVLTVIQQCSPGAMSDVHHMHTNKKKLTKRNNNGKKELNSIKDQNQLVEEHNSAMDQLTGVNPHLKEKLEKIFRPKRI